MDTNQQNLRVLLLKLQDRLTDDDRRRLHFFFGDDVPRRIRDDPSLGGTLSLLESLFEQDKINEKDFSSLIRAFDEIKCYEAANLLRNHVKNLKKSGEDSNLPILASVMPFSVDEKTVEETDKFNAFPGMFNVVVNEIQENLEQQAKPIGILVPQNVQHLNLRPLTKTRRTIINTSLACITLFLIVILITTFGFFIEQNRYNRSLHESIKLKDKSINEFQREKNQSALLIKELENRLHQTAQETNSSLIRVGRKFGGTGGSVFDDSMLNNFSCSFYLRGMAASRNSIAMDWLKFFYSSQEAPDVIIESGIIGQKGEGSNEEIFFLNSNERVSKVQLKLQIVELIVNGVKKSVKTVRGVRLFTTSGRASRFFDDDEGEITAEQFDGYTVGYARGRSGMMIDQIQFFWYRTVFN